MWFRVFRPHLQSQKRSDSRYWGCKFSCPCASVLSCWITLQGRWPSCILFSFPFPCRVHLAEEPVGDGSFCTGPLDWKYQISFTEEVSTAFILSVDGFGSSDTGRFVSQCVFNFPVMPCPDTITTHAQSWELQEWQKMCEYKNVHGLLSYKLLACSLVLKHIGKLQMSDVSYR